MKEGGERKMEEGDAWEREKRLSERRMRAMRARKGEGCLREREREKEKERKTGRKTR